MIKEILRASVFCLFAALALNVAFTQVTQPRGEVLAQPWLRVERLTPGSCNECFNLTVVYSKKEPAVWRLAKDRWVIYFKP